MGKLSTFTLVLISVLILIIGVQCHNRGGRPLKYPDVNPRGQPINPQTQTNLRGPFGNAAQRLFPPINSEGLQGMDRRLMTRDPRNAQAPSGPAGNQQSSLLSRVNATVLEHWWNKYMNMNTEGRRLFAQMIFNPDNYSSSVSLNPQSEGLYRAVRSLSDLNRRIWAELLQSHGIYPRPTSNLPAQNNAASSFLTPSLKRGLENTAGQSRKTQRTQDNAESRRGNLRIQEPVEVQSSSDESGKSQKGIDLGLGMYNQPNRGKSKMMPIPGQYKKSAMNPMSTASVGISHQPPHSAMQASNTRSEPGLSLAINENSEYTRAPQQTSEMNNINNDLLPEDFLTLATNKNSRYTRKYL